MLENTNTSASASPLALGNYDLIDKLSYPSLFQLAGYIPATIKPNQISFISFMCGITGALCLGFTSQSNGLLISCFFILLWWLFDALDGIHARRTQQCSAFGGFLDHFFDTIFAGVLFAAILIHCHMLTPLFVSLVILRLVTQAIGYLEQAHTHMLHLPTFGPSTETAFLISMLIMYYLYSDTFLLFGEIHLSWLAQGLQTAGIYEVNLPKLGILLYALSLPLVIRNMFRRAKKHTTSLTAIPESNSTSTI